jgi:hypothetical protein
VDQATGSLLVTDALVAISPTPPPLFDLDPTPLLFHAREVGSEPLVDTPANRLKGWKRIVLFANYFRPDVVSVPGLSSLLSDFVKATDRSPRCHLGFYPFRWSADWESCADTFLRGVDHDVGFTLAPVLERLVFIRARVIYAEWIATLSQCSDLRSLISAHYSAPHPITSANLYTFRDRLDQRTWARSDGAWQLLASIDRFLLESHLVPGNPSIDNSS